MNGTVRFELTKQPFRMAISCGCFSGYRVKRVVNNHDVIHVDSS